MMQGKRIEPILAVIMWNHNGVFDVAKGSAPFALVMAITERMMKETRIEPIVAVKDHDGVLDEGMGSKAPLGSVMAEYIS